MPVAHRSKVLRDPALTIVQVEPQLWCLVGVNASIPTQQVLLALAALRQGQRIPFSMFLLCQLSLRLSHPTQASAHCQGTRHLL